MISTLVRTFTILGSRLLTRAAQMVAFVLLARVLSPGGFGAYGVLTSAVFLTGQIGNLGLRQSAAYRIGRKQMTDGEAMGVMFAFWPFASIACIGSLLVLCHEALAAIGGLEAKIAIAIAMTALLLITLFQGIFLGRGGIKQFALADSGPRVLQSVLVGGLWLLGFLTLQTAVWSFAVSFLILAPVVLWMCLKGAAPLKFSVSTAPDMIRHGFLFALSMFFIGLQGRVGVFFLSTTAGDVAAGQFFAAQRACEIFLELATAVGLVLFSDAARSDSVGENLKSAMAVAASMFLLFLAIGAGIAIAAPLFVSIVLGAAYADAVPAIRILAIGLAPAAFIKIMNGVIGGSGKPFISAGVIGGGLVLNVVVAFALSGRGGFLAPAWSMVISQFAMAIAYVAVCKFSFGVTMSPPEAPRFLKRKSLKA